MEPIRAVFSDNEGCILPGKGLAFPLLQLHELRSMLQQRPNLGFGICTGRSIPYIEAMVQALDLLQSRVPCICEGGAALYWPRSDTWEVTAPLPDKGLLLHQFTGLNYREEPGKVACLSLYPNAPSTVDELYAACVGTLFTNRYHVSKSAAAVDITVYGVDKSFGIRKACDSLGISPLNVLCIGDAQNDIPMLASCGYSACPANAVAEVKGIVDFISSRETTEGIIDILQHFSELIAE